MRNPSKITSQDVGQGFHHGDFLRPKRMPGGPRDGPPGPGPVPGVIAYSLDFGPVLVGPFTPVVKMADERNSRSTRLWKALYIAAPDGSRYWYDRDNGGWCQSGYYLRFRKDTP